MTGSLLAAGLRLASATSSPTATLPGGSSVPAPESVTPGVLGFLSIFVVAVATVFLLLSMTRKLRRLSFLKEAEEREGRQPGVVPGERPGTPPS